MSLTSVRPSRVDFWPADHQGAHQRIGRVESLSITRCTSKSGTMISVFNYFAGQIFDQATVEVREFLMRTDTPADHPQNG